MRLWHKDLIHILPDKQLVSQWRECCAISARVASDGIPNHILVNKVVKYPISHFILYTNKVLSEMKKRQYRVSEGSYLRLVDNLNKGKDYFIAGVLTNDDIYPEWMNERYLRQCFYNLQEKYDCGGISEEEWKPIQDLYHNYIRKELERKLNERRQKE